MKEPLERRVIMAKSLARRWLRKKVSAEYRFTIYSPHKVNGLGSLLQSFRNNRLKLGATLPLPDLGIEEKPDSISVWSKDPGALRSLQEWLEVRGCETSGIW